MGEIKSNNHLSTINQLETPKFERWELKDIILRVLGVSLIVGGTIVFPNLPIVIGTFMKLAEEIKGQKIPKAKIKRALKNLEKNKLLFIEEKNNEIYVHIKDKYNPLILKYSIKSLLEFKKKVKKWKGKWFMVFFDVPEEERIKRDYLRKFLTDLGFYQYQKSVYLFPYECENEIKLIKKIIEGGKYMKYIIADKIEDENTAKIYFNLT